MPDTLPQRRMLPTLLLLVAAASWGGNWVAARAVYLDVGEIVVLTSKR